MERHFLYVIFVTSVVLIETKAEVCDITDTYLSITTKCIPAILNAIDDGASCESIDSYWTCIENIAEKCKLPLAVTQDLIMTARKLIKLTVSCSGTNIQCSITLLIFCCGFLIMRYFEKGT